MSMLELLLAGNGFDPRFQLGAVRSMGEHEQRKNERDETGKPGGELEHGNYPWPAIGAARLQSYQPTRGESSGKRGFGLEVADSAYCGFRTADCGFKRPESAIRNPQSAILRNPQFPEVLMIRKLSSGGYRLYSRKKDPKTGKRRNLGTFSSRRAAEQHERAVQFFKRR